MKNFKKVMVGVVAGLSLFTFASCNKNDNSNTSSAEEAGTKVVLTQNKKEVTADFKVTGVVKLDDKEYNVTWKSDNEYAVVGDLADNFYTIKIRYAENYSADQSVKLTATITNKDDENDTYTKEFEFKIPKFNATSIEEYDAAKAGDTVTVKGIVVAKEAYDSSYKNGSVYVQDISGNGGYYAYRVKADSQAAYDSDLAIGNTVLITGKKALYNGLREFDSTGCTYTLVSKNNNDQIKNTNVTDLIKGSGVTAALQNQLISFDNLEIVSIGSKDNKSRYNITVCDPANSEKTFVVRVNTYLTEATGDAYKAIEALKLQPGMTISAKGLCGWNNGAQLYPMAADSITVGATNTAKIAAATLANEASELFPAMIYGAKSYTLPTTIEGDDYKDMVVEWTSSSENAVIADNKLTTKLVSADEEVTLTCKVTIGDNEETKTVTLKLVKEIIYDSHADYVAAKNGDSITVKGVVTAINGNYLFYIQDNDGAYAIYGKNFTVKAGQEVSVTGTKDIANGVLKLKDSEIIETKEGTKLTPTDITADLTANGLVNDNAKQGQYVTLTGVVSKISGNNITVKLGEKSIIIYAGAVPELLKVGQNITATGVITYYKKGDTTGTTTDGTAEIQTFLESDIVLNLTDQEKVDLVIEAAQKLISNDTYSEVTTIEFKTYFDGVTLNITLPTDAATIVFDAASKKLTITPTDNELTESITITATLNETSKTSSEIAIKSKKLADNVKKATLAFKGSTAVSMTDSTKNYASDLGLDENIFIVRAVKGTDATYPSVVGLNTGSKGYIRIGAKCQFIIEVKNISGYTITINDVTLSNTGVSSAKTGTFTVNGEDGDMKKYTINGTTVTIDVTDASTNRDLKSIEITYTMTPVTAE